MPRVSGEEAVARVRSGNRASGEKQHYRNTREPAQHSAEEGG